MVDAGKCEQVQARRSTADGCRSPKHQWRIGQRWLPWLPKSLPHGGSWGRFRADPCLCSLSLGDRSAAVCLLVLVLFPCCTFITIHRTHLACLCTDPIFTQSSPLFNSRLTSYVLQFLPYTLFALAVYLIVISTGATQSTLLFALSNRHLYAQGPHELNSP